MSTPITTYCLYLKSKGIGYQTEYKFHPKRKWRADLYIPSLNVLVEYEGIFSAKSRHTSLTGYVGDTEKYNQASILGYRLLRYTAKNKNQFYNDIEKLTETQTK